MGISVSAVTCSKKVKFIRIDGSTPAQTRGDLVNKFQQNADVRVAILSINAAGTGLTLTVSHAFALPAPTTSGQLQVPDLQDASANSVWCCKQDPTIMRKWPISACRRAESR